jgi:uncharacterized protein Yka (UPF0111/DUF47 family)
MNQTAKLITLFELRSFQPHMQQMGEIIVQAANLMVDAVPLLSSLGSESARLNSLAEEMIRLEEQADNLHDEGRKQLFLNQKDAIAFVIGTEAISKWSWIASRMLRTRSALSSSRMCRARILASNGCHAQLVGSGRANCGRADLRLVEWPA